MSDSSLLVHRTRVLVPFLHPLFVFSYFDKVCLYHTQCTCKSLIPTDNEQSQTLLNVKMDGYNEVNHLWYWCQCRDWDCAHFPRPFSISTTQSNREILLFFNLFLFLFFFYQTYFICIDFCWQTLLSEGCCFRIGIPHIDIMRILPKLFRNHLAFYCPFILGACPTTWGKKTVSALNSTFFRCLLHNGALRTKVIALSFYCSSISLF